MLSLLIPNKRRSKMIEIKMFQEMIYRIVIDEDGNVGVFVREEDLENIIEELERLRDEK